MLRLLGLLPPLEPTAAELAEARILEQTGYTSETIEGFKQTIREREAQIKQMEEQLTTRILMLQKERDEALLGMRVGLPEGAHLPPSIESAQLTTNRDRIETTEGGDEAEARPLAPSSGELSVRAREEYEQQIHSLTEQLRHLQSTVAYAGQPYGHATQQTADGQLAAASSPPGADGPSISQLQDPATPITTNSISSSYISSPALEVSDSTLRDLSTRLAHAQSHIAELRGQVESERSEKEAVERHLAGLLASPALTKAMSPTQQMQYPEGTEENKEGADNSMAHHVSVGSAPVSSSFASHPSPCGSSSSTGSSDGGSLRDAAPSADEFVHLRAELHQLRRERHSLQTAIAEERAQIAAAQQQMQEAESAMKAQIDALQQQLQSQQRAHQDAIAYFDSQSADQQSRLHHAESELVRLQHELLARNSIDHGATSPLGGSPPPATAAGSSSSEVAALQQQLQDQAAYYDADKKRTQLMLNEKLEKVKTIIASKDDAIQKLKAQIKQMQMHQPQIQLQPPQHARTPQKYAEPEFHVPQ